MIRFCNILLILIFLSCNSFGQLLGAKHFSLPNNGTPLTFNVVINSAKGFMYAATTGGCYKFNGTTFSLIEKTDSVTAIAEDNNKQIWLGFANGKIASIVNGKYKFYNPEEGLPKKPINSIVFDKNNNLWFTVIGEGVYHTQNSHLYLINEENGLNDLNNKNLFVTNSRQILVSSDQGFFICNANGQNKAIKNISPKEGLADYIVTCFEKADEQHVFIGLQEKGYCVYNTLNNEIKTPIKNWQLGEIAALKFIGNNLWVATKENGLYKITNPFKEDCFPQKITDQSNIINLTTDNEENLWVCTKNEMIKTNGNKLSVLPLFDKKIYETIHAVLKTSDNTIWAGTDGGLLKYSLSNGVYQAKKISITGLNAQIDITSLCEDVYNNIWIATFGKGLFVLNPTSGNYRLIKENPLLVNASILAVTSKGNTVCAGGLEGVATIFELTEDNESINNPYQFTNYNDKQNIGNNYIYTVFKDSKNRIWFGTNAIGITVLQNGNYTNYNIQNGLDAKNVLAFTEDAKSNIWFCTESNGIYKYNGKLFKHFATEQGLTNLNVTNIKTDRNGNIVAAYKEGFDIIDASTEKINYINKQQGIGEFSIDVSTVTSDNNGNLLFTSIDGFVEYVAPNASAIKQPLTLIESVLLHLKPIDTIEHIFNYDENSLTFHFIGLWNTCPEMVQYQYKLVGYDSNWVSTNDHSKSFAQLKPGSYTFKVRSSLNSNFSGASEATFSFEIKQAFWKKMWFIISCALISIALMYWYIKEREKEIKKIQQLKNEKTDFQFQVLRNQVNPHFLFNSFNTLISTIEDDPKVAVDYVENLSDFFRNIVSYRDKDIITLKEELDILQTYIYLQQKRYGSNLSVIITSTDEQMESIYIPPLSLQLLVENAIKHNAVSSETPLQVTIIANNDYITISNNLNPKTNFEKSAGMGLQNIVNRYLLLSDKKVTVEKTSNEFIINLPTLKQ